MYGTLQTTLNVALALAILAVTSSIIRPDMTEKLLTGTLSLNTNKQIINGTDVDREPQR